MNPGTARPATGKPRRHPGTRPGRFARCAAALLATVSVLAGCERGSARHVPGEPASGPSGCPAAYDTARTAVVRAERTDVPWNGPTTGPPAVPGKSLVYVAQTMTNPGVAGALEGVRQAARVVGWNVRVIDGGGTPAGIQAAMGQAVALRPAGVVVAGFDPGTTSQQVARAAALRIPLVGWHAVAAPGPSRRPPLFSNVTTHVQDVARVSARWIIDDARGRAGVVVFTDDSIPFAHTKSRLITAELATCRGVRVLAYENIPIPDASTRIPRETAALLSRFGRRWTHSVAINDLYFADAGPALRAAGAPGAGPPYNIGAGDGDPSAFQRINSRQYQSATVPEPLTQQGWQIVDEFNRAFSHAPASGYAAPVHVSTAGNSHGADTWEPTGYQEAYRKIWRG